MDPFEATSMPDAIRERTDVLLGRIGKNPEAYGYDNEGEVILALGKQCDDFSGFGLLTGYLGRKAKYLGVWVCVITMIVGDILTLRQIFKAGVSIWDWASKTMGPVAGLIKTGFRWSPPGLLMRALGIMDDSNVHQYAAQASDPATTAVVQSMLLTFVPAPIALLATSAVDSLSSASPSVAPTTSTAAPSDSAAINVIRRLLPADMVPDGDEAAYDLNRDEVRAVADAVGCAYDDLLELLTEPE